MDNNFKDKTVIITGGSEGVGAATARKFADSGANLLLVARGKKNLEVIAEELRSKTRVEIMAMDVSDEDACANLFRKAAFEFGEIHVLINNAGYHERGAVESIATEDIGKMIEVNLKAPIVLCRLVVPWRNYQCRLACRSCASARRSNLLSDKIRLAGLYVCTG